MSEVLIPYQQGGLFRPSPYWVGRHQWCLNPLSAGRSFQTLVPRINWNADVSLNPLSAGRSFQTIKNGLMVLSQTVLIPYQQGGLFRRSFQRCNCSDNRLNPLSAGRSFQTFDVVDTNLDSISLNPLSAGRSFQTRRILSNVTHASVLIPYQQGGLFRLTVSRVQTFLNGS